MPEIRNIPIAQIKWIRSDKERAKVPANFFLLPGDRKFPYKNKDGTLNCNLLRAAITRAAQYGYASVESKARNLYEQYCQQTESESMLNVVKLDAQILKKGFWHNVLPIREFYDPRYGKVRITPELISLMAKNFEKGIPHYEPIVKIGHEGREAYGRVEKLEARDDGLWAFIILDNEGYELVKSEKFRYLSSEFTEHYTDKDTGEDVGAVFLGVALTNQPAHPSMTPIQVFEDIQAKEGTNVELEELNAKIRVLEEEKATLIKKFEEEKAALTKKFEEEKAALQKELEGKENELSEVKKKLEEDEAKLFEQHKEIWANERINEGNMPATVEKMKEMATTEEDLKTFEAVLATMPKVELGQKGRQEEVDKYKAAAGKIAEYAK